MINAHMGNDFHSQMFLTVEIFVIEVLLSYFVAFLCEKIKSDYINADFSQGVMITITIKFPTNLMNFRFAFKLNIVVDQKVTLIIPTHTRTHPQMIF